MTLQVSSIMLYNLDIDVGVYHLFLILCCSAYMVCSCKSGVTNQCCVLQQFLCYHYQKLNLTTK